MTEHTAHQHHQDNAQEATGIVVLLQDLMRHYKLGLGIFLACLILGVVISFLQPTVYTAKVTMLPQIESGGGDLLGTLATFTGMGSLEGGNYEELYGEILHSNKVLDAVIAVDWAERLAEPGLSLTAVLGLDETPADAQGKARQERRIKRRLRQQVIQFSREKFTGYMKLSTTLPDHPELAAGLANALADELAALIEDLRLNKARENRTFVQERLQEVETRLRGAEEERIEFELANRQHNDSPKLRQQHGELNRAVEALAGMWVTLKRELETAVIEEQKQTLAVTILDRAGTPHRPSGPNRVKIWILAMILGGLLAVIAVILRVQIPRYHRIIVDPDSRP